LSRKSYSDPLPNGRCRQRIIRDAPVVLITHVNSVGCVATSGLHRGPLGSGAVSLEASKCFPLDPQYPPSERTSRIGSLVPLPEVASGYSITRRRVGGFSMTTKKAAGGWRHLSPVNGTCVIAACPRWQRSGTSRICRRSLGASCTPGHFARPGVFPCCPRPGRRRAWVPRPQMQLFASR
jgi:hypothetical protein